MTEKEDNDDDEKAYLGKIRQILTRTKVEPAKSNTIVELFRRFFPPTTTTTRTDERQEKLENADCVQGCYHEIVPRLFLGDYRLAMDVVKLKKLGFTHVLNAAEGRKFGQINTSATYYEEVGIEYLGFSILDNVTYKIGMHFDEAIQFLEKALSNEKNRVYVHCQQGISRSATLIVAYLLHTYDKMSLLDAFQLVATRRRVWPNDGFCRHLLEFEKEKKNKKSTNENVDIICSAGVPIMDNELRNCTGNDENTGAEAVSTEP